MDDAGIKAGGWLCEVLLDDFAWATTTTLARYRASADNVPEGMSIVLAACSTAVHWQRHRRGRRLGCYAGHGMKNDLKQYAEPETVTLGLCGADRSGFRRAISVAVSSLEQDQSECQIEWQNRAREGLSRACECSRRLVFYEVSAVYLR
jgi:hypothetical protein